MAIVIPDTSEAMEEFLLDNKKRNEIFKADADPKDLTAFMSSYAKLFNKADPGVEQNVQEQIDRALASFAKEHMVNLLRPDMRPASAADVKQSKSTGAKYAANADGVALDGKFTSIMDFLGVVHSEADPREERIGNLRKTIRNAMSSTDPASGGFLVPEEFRAELLRVALESAIVRPRARVIPMASLRAAMPMIDSTTNNGSVYGGVIAYWTEEGAALVQSQPNFGRVVLEAKKLTAYTEVPNELRQDSIISVEALLDDIFPQAIAWFEDIAFLTGTGVGEPLGVFNTLNNAIVVQPKESGQATLTILWENIVGMYARMLPSSLSSAVWIVSPDTLPQLMTTALSVGTGGAPIGMANFDGMSGPQLSLLGRPVIVSEKVSSLTSQGDISFVDFKQYLIGDRMAMDAQVSVDYRFGNDVTAYRFIERVDGRPWMQSAVTPKNGGNTLSPYVQLAAR